VFGIFWKGARIGERLSPYVSICCVLMAVSGFLSGVGLERRAGQEGGSGAKSGVKMTVWRGRIVLIVGGIV